MEIPTWLQSSELYQNAMTSGLELTLDSFDFEATVGCMDYWGVYEWPDSLYLFVSSHVTEVKQWRDVSECATSHHMDLNDIILNEISVINSEKMLEKLCEIGSIGWLKYMHIKCGYNWDSSASVYSTACTYAARGGHLLCLKYALANGCPHGKVCEYAALSGHLACLECAHMNGCHWDEGVTWRAACCGSFSCLVYAHVNGCPWDENTCWRAASGGYLSCLEFANANRCPWDETTCYVAAKNGHLSCLKYAHENGCPWHMETCDMAAASNNLSCLKYAHENGCPWSKRTWYLAERSGASLCLVYARNHGCPEVVRCLS